MSEFVEGDLVEAVNGETVVRGRLVASLSATNRHVIELPYVSRGETPFIEAYPRAGFTLTLIEKAKPELPTEPGHYLDRKGNGWHIHEGAADSLPEEHAPYTRLEPVADTATRFVDALAKVVNAEIAANPTWYQKGTAGEILDMARAIAKEFGAE